MKQGAPIEKTGVVAAVMAAVSAYMAEEEGRRGISKGISIGVRPSRWQQWGREEMMRMRSLWQRRLCS